MSVSWGPSSDGRFRVQGEDGQVEVLGESRRLAEARAKQLAGPQGVVQRRYFTVGGQVQADAAVEPAGPAAPHAGAELTDADIAKLTPEEIEQGQRDLDELLEDEGISRDEFLDENRSVDDDSLDEEAAELARLAGEARERQAAAEPVDRTPAPPAPVELLDGNVAAVSAALEAIVDHAQLDALEAAELAGKTRKGVLTAIGERRAALATAE